MATLSAEGAVVEDEPAAPAGPRDPTLIYFTNTLFDSAPVSVGEPFPSLPDPPDQKVPPRPHFFPLPITLSMSPRPPINLVHQHVGWALPEKWEWNPRMAILRGDPFHLRYDYGSEVLWQRGRLMLGMNAQGPPGNGHGGSIAAVLDDMVGNFGANAAMQLHMEGKIQSMPEFAHIPPDTHTYIARALDRYDALPEAERARIPIHPDLTIDGLRTLRDKRLPYTPAEISFIVPVLATSMRRGGTGRDGSSAPPSILVSEISCKLKRRIPLLTRLAVRARLAGVEGKRIRVVAEIWGKKNTRISALEEDVSGGWEGHWDVLLAEGKGTCVILYNPEFMNPNKGKGSAKM
ncbi:hypothetical protein DFJ74DRAFT_654283 [Hyaloraphidium curvatum]|nr:hypothetical protein DFJ74DRAFT_654283 [Hyaloraphidium curvatum]